MLEEHTQGIILSVRVHPGAKRNEIRGEQAGALRVSVTTAPEKGKANKTLIEFLAKSFAVRRSQMEIISGETSSQKRICFTDISLEQLREKINEHISNE